MPTKEKDKQIYWEDGLPDPTENGDNQSLIESAEEDLQPGRDAALNSIVDKAKQAENTLSRSISQGGTANLHDELVGAIKAPMKSLYDYAKSYLNGGGDKSNLIENYKKYRQQERSADQKAQSDQPGLYAAGQFAGGAALPGGSVKSIAAQGALSGYGASDSDNIQDDLQNAVIGGAIGAGFGKLASKIGKGKSVANLEDSPQLPKKGGLELHQDATPLVNNNPTAADRIAAFRKRQEQGLNVRNKSDELAEEMFGLKVGEKPYDPTVDDISVPIDKRQDFGRPSGVPPKSVKQDEMERYRMLIGERQMPKQSRVPSDIDYDSYGNPIKFKDPDHLVYNLKDKPELFGKYGPLLQKALQRGNTSLASTVYVLGNKDPEFRKLIIDMQTEPVDADNLK